MDLKEAKERLKLTSKQCHENKECWDTEFCGDCYMEIETVFAIDRVLQELDNLQKENHGKDCIIATLDHNEEVKDEYIKHLEEKTRNSISKDKLIEAIDFAINATDSTDDYSIGLCNGMIYVKALLTDENPDYKKCQNNEEEKTYEFGLIVGTKREREYWQNKIKKQIEEIDDKRGYVNGWESEFEYATAVLQDLLKEE